ETETSKGCRIAAVGRPGPTHQRVLGDGPCGVACRAQHIKDVVCGTVVSRLNKIEILMVGIVRQPRQARDCPTRRRRNGHNLNRRSGARSLTEVNRTPESFGGTKIAAGTG